MLHGHLKRLVLQCHNLFDNAQIKISYYTIVVTPIHQGVVVKNPAPNMHLIVAGALLDALESV